ncbi:MAG: hypothetical protein ACK52C_04420 [Planctomycetia bacterium]
MSNPLPNRLVSSAFILSAALVASLAHAHGGGGGHMGGMGGGGHMGGYGGPHMGGGFDGGGARGFDGGGARGFDGGDRGFDGGARGFDGGRSLDGAREFGGLDGAAGHFAGDHNIARGDFSKADFQRIANQGIARDGLGRGAVRPYSIDSLANRGDAIRNNFYHGGWYGGRGWYNDHFNAWWPGGWWGGFGWGMMAGLAWSDLVGWGGYRAAPVAYNYGTNVVYEDDGVYVQGSRVGSAEEYAQQASTLAGQGSSATVAADDQWRPLGVFALARKEETSPGTFLSLAIDKAGLLRGTYYDAVSDSTQNVTGKVDKQTQRAAWTIGDKKMPVYEAGLSNRPQQPTTILVHRDGGKVEQMLLVRVQDPKGSGGASGPRPAAKPRQNADVDRDSDVQDPDRPDRDEVDAGVSEPTGSGS